MMSCSFLSFFLFISILLISSATDTYEYLVDNHKNCHYKMFNHENSHGSKP